MKELYELLLIGQRLRGHFCTVMICVRSPVMTSSGAGTMGGGTLNG